MIEFNTELGQYTCKGRSFQRIVSSFNYTFDKSTNGKSFDF
jgi:hypothetical protein